MNYTILNACSCDTIAFESAVEFADEIFIGKIVKAERYESDRFVNENGQEEVELIWKYHFDVIKKWKGNHKSKLTIFHQGSSCDYWFDIYKEQYLVYALLGSNGRNIYSESASTSAGKKKLTTWLCSRTIHSSILDRENWCKSDIIKLDEKYQAIDMRCEYCNRIWLIGLGSIILIGLYFISLKANSKDKQETRKL